MRYIALSLALIGILSLSLLLNFSSPVKVKDYSDLLSYQENQKVELIDTVITQKTKGELSTLKLSNNITLLCDCDALPDVEGKEVKVIGTIDKFQYTKVNVLSIEWKD